jgi:nitroreductase
MAAVVNYADIVRELFAIPENKTIVMGAILGWPDPEAAVNQFERQRGGLDKFVRWVR